MPSLHMCPSDSQGPAVPLCLFCCAGKPPLHRTAGSQVQSYRGLHRTAMFEHPNPQPSLFLRTSIAAAVATSPPPPPPPTTASVMFCTQTQRGPGLRETFVRPSKGELNLLDDKTLFRPVSLKSVTRRELYQKPEHTHTHIETL